MEAVSKSIQLLLISVKESSVYKEYKKQQELLEKNQELKEKVDWLRVNNFKLLNETGKEHFFEESEKLCRESAELRKISEVNAYLDAELALCKMMQRICEDLMAGVDMDVPDI